MKRQWLAMVAVVLAWIATLMLLFCLAGATGIDTSRAAFAAQPKAAPTITEVDPPSTANDLDTPIVVTGTNFAAVLSGTEVVTAPMVYLGATSLENVEWLSSSRLTAIVPWGLVTGTYTMTVINPDGVTGTLPHAFTVTQGFDVWTTGGPYGGVVRQLFLDPATPATLYAIIIQVGAFASHDGAATWEMILRDDLPTRMVMDAQNPQVMYIGGESYGNVLRTWDGGVTWEDITPPPVEWSHFFRLYHPAAHPISSGVLYVAVHAPEDPDKSGNLYRSDDYGDHWITATTGLTDVHVTDVAFHPDDPNRMLAGTFSGNIFLSSDGGQHWSWVARPSPHVERLYFNPNGAHEAWTTTYGLHGGEQPEHYLYKSADPALLAWTPITVTDVPSLSYPVQSLSFFSDTIWAAAGYGYTSTNGGETWSAVGWDGVSAGDEVGEFAIDPGQSNVVYAGHSQGGIYKSSDSGNTWNEANQGLGGIAPLVLAVSPTEPDLLYTSIWERGILKSNNGGRSWLSMGIWSHTTRPGLLAVDPFSPTRVYEAHSCTGAMCVRISEDAGTTWHIVSTTLPLTMSEYLCDTYVVAAHPQVPGRVLAGVSFCLGDHWCPGSVQGGIFASDDYGAHWTYGQPTQPISTVVSLAYDAHDPNVAYAGSGGLWKSTDGGVSWATTPYTGVPDVNWVGVHPGLTDTVYVLAENFDGSTLYRSPDGGESWQQVSTLAQGQVLFIPPVPDAPSYKLYTVCGRGMCVSVDGGYTWQPVEGVPRPTALAASTDGERVVIYVSTPGGMASPITSTIEVNQAVANVIPGRGSLLAGGVYRLTLRSSDRWVYLPLVLRASP